MNQQYAREISQMFQSQSHLEIWFVIVIETSGIPVHIADSVLILPHYFKYFNVLKS
jgi:hypothetical protein